MMHLRFLQLALFSCVFLLELHSLAGAEATPAPSPPTTWPPPIPTPPPIASPTVSPSPDPRDLINDDLIPPTPAPAITPPAETPSPSPNLTIPPVGPSPIATPTGTPLPYEPPVNTPSPPPTPDPGTIIADPPVGIGTGPTPNPAINLEDAIPVIVTFGEGLETRAAIVQGLMLPVGVPRKKSVTVSLLLPATYAGQVVSLTLYDGGWVGAPAPPGTPSAPSGIQVGDGAPITFLVAAAHDGTVHFNFESGALLGRYRVGVAVGPERYLLQFQAVKPRPLPVSIAAPQPVATPSITPPALPGASPTPEKWPPPD